MKVITQTPLRISFVGGGTDIPAFYERHGGAVISITIDKYVTVTLESRVAYKGFALRFNGEHLGWRTVDEVRQPIVRECLKVLGIEGGISIKIESDIEPGSGLGSSSALVVGLLNALMVYKGTNLEFRSETLARLACEVEIDKLGSPIGKQDQYAASYGGLKRYDFYADGKVGVECIVPCQDFQRSLMLFDTGIRREANAILNSEMDVDSLHHIKENVQAFYDLLTIRCTNPDARFAHILTHSWTAKKQAFGGVTNKELNETYNAALDAGALGGKLLGAGGGGHFLFVVPKEIDQANVVWALDKLGVKHVPFNFEPRGTRLVKEANIERSEAAD